MLADIDKLLLNSLLDANGSLINYGGDNVSVKLQHSGQSTLLTVTDNSNGTFSTSTALNFHGKFDVIIISKYFKSQNLHWLAVVINFSFNINICAIINQFKEAPFLQRFPLLHLDLFKQLTQVQMIDKYNSCKDPPNCCNSFRSCYYVCSKLGCMAWIERTAPKLSRCTLGTNHEIQVRKFSCSGCTSNFLYRNIIFEKKVNNSITRYIAKHDGNTLGYVEYNASTCVLTLVNNGKSITRKALALGGTGKSENKDAAGQFGEGLNEFEEVSESART